MSGSILVLLVFYRKQFIKTFKPHFTKEVDIDDAACMLAGKLDLSQRKYKNLKEVLDRQDINLYFLELLMLVQ